MQDKMLELITKLETFIGENAGTAYNMIVEMVRIDALQQLICGFVCLIFLGVSLSFVIRGINMKDKPWFNNNDHNDLSQRSAYTIFGGIFSVPFFIISLYKLVSVWNWVSLFNPELGLAHKIFGG